MAGGAGTYLIDGIAYSTVSGFSTQLIADEDGAATTEEQVGLMSVDVVNDDWVLPTTAQVDAGREFPVAVRSADPNNPNTWSHDADDLISNVGADCYVKLEDLILTITIVGRAVMVTGANASVRPIEINDCVTTTNAGYVFKGARNKSLIMNGGSFSGQVLRAGTSTNSGSITLKHLKADLSLSIWRGGAWQVGSLNIVGCRFLLGGGDAAIMPTVWLPQATLLHNVFWFIASNYLFKTTAAPALLAWPFIRMNIIHNAKGLITSSVSAHVETPLTVIGDNIWSSIDAAGNNFINTTDPVTTLANWQTLGQEDGSSQETITAASTTLADADFLDPNVDPGTKRTAGVFVDRDGTLMQRYDLINPGAKQFTAAVTGGGGVRIRGIQTGGRM